jgi:hypothetical protein
VSVHVPNCKYFLLTEAERKHVRRRASLVAVACFIPGRTKDLSAPRYFAFCWLNLQLQVGKLGNLLGILNRVTGNCKLCFPHACGSFIFVNVKRKAIPLQAWTGPEGSRRLRLPDFKTIGT